MPGLARSEAAAFLDHYLNGCMSGTALMQWATDSFLKLANQPANLATVPRDICTLELIFVACFTACRRELAEPVRACVTATVPYYLVRVHR